MRQGIVIATSVATESFFQDCLKSLVGVEYPILVVANGGVFPQGSDKWLLESSVVVNDWNGFELGAIERGAEVFDEFVFLPDSTIVKDRSVFGRVFEIDGSVHFSKRFFHYMGKYRSEIVHKIGVPRITEKEDAIRLEVDWNEKYMRAENRGVTFFQPELPVVSDVFEDRYGRRNMVVQNEYFIKYKGTYR